jgi:formate dehydrogenase subunit gamma
VSRTATEAVVRFGLTERLVHWSFAISFLVLLATGVMLALPDLEVLLAHRDVISAVHVWSGVAMVALPVAAALAGDRGALRRDLREIDVWDRLDLRWLRLAFVPWFLRREPMPAAGRFNAGQKLNSILIGSLTVGLVVTGCLMWRAELFPIWFGEVASQLHDLLTLLAVPLVAGHLYLALLNPGTRGSLSGMLSGRVDARWVREHHGRAG